MLATTVDYLKKCDVEQRFRYIFAGSCTPGCDLEEAIELGLVTRKEADYRVQLRYPTLNSVRALADAERAYCRTKNI